MTVRKLITELSKYPQDLEVYAGEIWLDDYEIVNVKEVRNKDAVPSHFVALELEC